MGKIVCFFYLLFNSFVFAELSDQQKRDIIGSLAKPSKERRVFYRWHTKSSNKKLITAGEMTTIEIHKFLRKGGHKGLYVSEDIGSSSAYGNHLMQMVVEKGYEFFYMRDQKVWIQLRERGISQSDVYRLGYWLAVPDFLFNFDNNSWWNLKSGEGVKFEPFSSDEISLHELERAYERLEETAPKNYSGFFRFFDRPFNLSEKRNYFRDIIREDILNRAAESAAIYRGPFVNIVEEEYGKEYVTDKVSHYSQNIVNLEEVAKWFKYAGGYLSEKDKRRVVERAKQLLIKAMDYDSDFLTAAKKFISELEQIERYLSASEREDFFRKFRSREQNSINAKIEEETCVSVYK